MSTPFTRFIRKFHKRWNYDYAGWRSFSSKNSPRLFTFPYLYIHGRKHHQFYCNLWTCRILPSIALLSKTVESEITNSDVEDNISHLLTLARIALERGDADRAEAILNMGLKISEDHHVYIGMPYMYDVLTSIALARGEIDKAEKLLVSAIEKMILIGLPENNHHIIDFKLRLARIYSSFKEKNLAEIGFKTCLEAQKHKIVNGDNSTRTGMLYVNILFWYGVHFIRNDQYSDAKKLLDKAYDYAIKIKGLSPYQEMVILYTLGDLNSELGYHDVALQYMLNAILLGKGISSVDLPRCYVKLAKIYSKMGIFEQAKTSAEEAEKLAKLFNYPDVLVEANVVLQEISQAEKFNRFNT